MRVYPYYRAEFSSTRPYGEPSWHLFLSPLVNRKGIAVLRLIWFASVRVHAVLRWAPTNLLLARIHTRRSLKWGIPAMLIAIPLFAAAAACAYFVQHGGPGWLNLLVLLFIWDACKFVWIGPVSLVHLLVARMREHRARTVAP